MKDNIEKRGFASDNNAGIHPDILKEIIASNNGHVTGYGSDIYTEHATDNYLKNIWEALQKHFLYSPARLPMFLAFHEITRSWNSVITASTAHLEGDECGAPEKFIGCKILVVDTPDGKIKSRLD